ncbi:MAG: hypothetical protein A3J83_02150 [Elusimicrobia bacterium RIFOXYA2_FULL_40_6]|nr:MAG: hypothetical protein A3J83_02150 [Elusimicrobia bacterium RIFOXYA2_FULL_40_6]
MKICFITNYLPGYHKHAGGAEQAILRMEKIARENRFETCFITLPFTKEPADKKNVYPAPVIEKYFGFLGRYIEILKWYAWQFDPVSYSAIKEILKKEKPDIINLGNFQFLTFSAVMAAKKAGIPAALFIYDYWYFCPLTTLYDYNDKICRKFHGSYCVQCLPKTMSFVQKLLLSVRKRIIDKYLKEIDKFLVLSESSKSILSDYGINKERIEVIRLPLAEGFVKDGPVGKADNILFMGWLQKRKGLHILLDAMLEVWKKFPKVKLTIVAQKAKWEKEYEQIIESKLKNLPEGRYEFITGQKSAEEVKQLMAEAGIIAVPEQWENMSPLIITEAMLMGKAVVASNIGGIPEFIENKKDGMLAKHDSPQDFAQKIIYLLENKQEAETIRANASRKISGMLSKEKISKEYARVMAQFCYN